MNNVFNYFLESGLCLAVLSLFFLLALRQEKAFSFNRFYLLASVVFSLIVPLLHLSINSIPSPLAVGTITLDALEISNTESTTGAFSSVELLSTIYILIATGLLIRVVSKAMGLWVMSRTAELYGDYRLCTLPNSREAYTFVNTIFIGDDLQTREKELILSHEKVHAGEMHSIDILFLEIISALLWINPILYFIKKMARVNHEYLADAQAVHAHDKDHYIQILAVHTLKIHGFELAHSFYNSSILNRIKMINQQNKQTMKIKQILPFTLGLALVLVFGCEDINQELSDQSDIEAAQTISTYADEIFDKVEDLPMPRGGMPSFYEWVGQNMKYPVQAKEAGVEGRVFVQFVVDESGKLTDPTVLKGIGAGCDEEVIRIIKEATNWAPGKIEGNSVKVKMILPITFKLS
ncbi:M56 family metallopeptidase [Reichenbachiella carrageenanivorans]|uniref:M56 family metallopeptidase n=1 Tax=Reichenbachiella carrageenanivorans TaxID=2979869 RepID=A0ABY6CXV8_9BACT|nr:M56 family metallopeptidase [Reichenbachiella carrageenanivorans]UXX77683.1 M56 family metallopeptidase [Reichenbachiella carrageenanivorans]